MAYIRITGRSWEAGKLEGNLEANDLSWDFTWHFRQGKLQVHPSLGRALIQDALLKFLVQQDYYLEPGGDYSLEIRGRI
jgi:hypothetical protein